MRMSCLGLALTALIFSSSSFGEVDGFNSLGSGRACGRSAARAPFRVASSTSALSAVAVSGSLATEGDWSAYLDSDTTGLVYYHNARTGESAWEPPSPSFPLPRLSRREQRLARRKLEEYRASDAWAEAKRNMRGVLGVGGDALGKLAGVAASGMGGVFETVVDSVAVGARAAVETAKEKKGEESIFDKVFRGFDVFAEPQVVAAAAPPVWTWRGHAIHAEVIPPSAASSSAPLGSALPSVVILIHGFGASTTYWRTTAAALSEAGYEVHALDLLGQGRSAKPWDGENGDSAGVEYGVRLWAEMVDDYARNFVGSGGRQKRDVFLVGNSLGSVVALAAAAGLYLDDAEASEGRRRRKGGYLSKPGGVSGVCLFNCAVGMNSRGIPDLEQYDPIRRALFDAVLSVSDALVFDNPPVLRFLLDVVVTRDLLRDALTALYKHDPSRVDDVLVEAFYRPAKDGGPGAAEALRQIYTNDPGPTPMELHQLYGTRLGQIPIHLVWGDEDEVTPLGGPVGRFYSGLAAKAGKDEGGKVTMDVVSAGHLPFDDNPEESNGSMLQWLEVLKGGEGVKRTTTITVSSDGGDDSGERELLGWRLDGLFVR